MERWEYMTVESEATSHAGTVLSIIQGPHYHPNSVDIGGEISGDMTLGLLDRLGAEGWEVIDVRKYADGSTFWLKRRRNE